MASSAAATKRKAEADLGRVAFEAYAAAIDGDGAASARPNWEARLTATPHVCDAWRVAALAVVAASQED